MLYHYMFPRTSPPTQLKPSRDRRTDFLYCQLLYWSSHPLQFAWTLNLTLDPILPQHQTNLLQLPTLQIQPELLYTNILAFSTPRKGFNWNLHDTNIIFWTTPFLKKTTTFQHHSIQAYHHCIQTTKNFIADGDISHTLLPTDTWSYSLPNADTRSQDLLRNSRTTWNSYAILVHRMHFLFTQPNWIPWPHRLSLCLPTDVPKRPHPSVVLLTTISPIIVLTHRSTTLILPIMTYHLMLHITLSTQPIHRLSHVSAPAAKLNLLTFS